MDNNNNRSAKPIDLGISLLHSTTDSSVEDAQNMPFTFFFLQHHPHFLLFDDDDDNDDDMPATIDNKQAS